MRWKCEVECEMGVWMGTGSENPKKKQQRVEIASYAITCINVDKDIVIQGIC